MGLVDFAIPSKKHDMVNENYMGDNSGMFRSTSAMHGATTQGC